MWSIMEYNGIYLMQCLDGKFNEAMLSTLEVAPKKYQLA